MAHPDPLANQTDPVRPNNQTRLDAAARKITAAGRLLQAVAFFAWTAGKLLMLAASIIAIGWIGRSLIDRQAAAPKARPIAPIETVAAPAPIAWEKVDAEVARAATAARQRAEQYAADDLAVWKADLMARIDEDFLPWYFGYWTQQQMGLRATWQDSKRWLVGWFARAEIPTAAEQMIEQIQQEFANRVLRPEIAQLHIERVTKQAVNLYVDDLRRQLEVVQVRYRIPQADWDHYLESIGTSIGRVDGNRQVPLTLKAMTATTAGGAVLLTQALAGIARRVETRIASRASAEGIEKIAARTGSKFAARAGGRFLGPIIAVAVIAWDVWDHRQTVAENRPVLRENLSEYLDLLTDHLLRDPETGVLAIVYQVEAEVMAATIDPPDPAPAAQGI